MKHCITHLIDLLKMLINSKTKQVKVFMNKSLIQMSQSKMLIHCVTVSITHPKNAVSFKMKE